MTEADLTLPDNSICNEQFLFVGGEFVFERAIVLYTKGR